MTTATAATVRKEWGAALRREREQRGLTQAALAAEAGIDQASVSRVEAGAGRLDSYIAVASVLGVKILGTDL